jgi:hypothetical protein
MDFWKKYKFKYENTSKYIKHSHQKIKKNSMASVHKRTIPTERQPLVSEVSASFLRIEGATWSA